MNAKNFYLLAVAALPFMVGCSENDNSEQMVETTISLKAAVGDNPVAATRAGIGVQETRFDPNEMVYAYIPTGASHSSGSFKVLDFPEGYLQPVAPSYPAHFEAGASSVTIHAYYPYADGKQVTNATTSFSVEQNQTTDANYKKSDLMYASTTIQKSDPHGNLVFSHKMAKVLVNATPGEGVNEIRSVRIVGGYRTINIATPLTCTLGTGKSDGLSTSNYLLMWSGASTSTVSCAALIPPQQISGSFLQVETDQGTATYNLASAITFASGRCYQRNITVSIPSVEANPSYTITDWQPEGTWTPNAPGFLTIDDITTTYTYNGSAKTPTPVVRHNGSVLVQNTHYTVEYKDNVNAGTAAVLVKGKPGTKYEGATAAKTFTINKANGYLTLSATSETWNTGIAGYVNVVSSHGGTISATRYSGDVLQTGPYVTDNCINFVPSQSDGSTTVIRVTCAATNNYKAATCDYTVKTPKAMTAVATGDVGKVICVDGYIYDNLEAATHCGQTVAGMIAYVGSSNGALGMNSYSNSLNHGLAISVEEIASTLGYPGATKLRWNDAKTGVSNYGHAKPSNTSAWMLPTIQQWERMFTACGGSTSFIASPTNSPLSYAHGYIRYMMYTYSTNSFLCESGDYYWTATEYSSGSSAWAYSFSNSEFSSYTISYGCYTRACFAF